MNFTSLFSVSNLTKNLFVTLIGMQILASQSFALKFDPNVTPNVQTEFAADLQFIAQIQGTTASTFHQKVFGPSVAGPAYMNFFDQRILNVRMGNCGLSAAVACVIGGIPNTMNLTPNYTTINHPQIARLMVIFHESRHTEAAKGGWPHALCPNPFNNASGQPMKSIWTGAPLAGMPGCDTTPAGAYGISIILLENIAHSCTNCNDKVKMDAHLFASDQMDRIIDPKAYQALSRDLSH
jgi:hypothetical protein